MNEETDSGWMAKAIYQGSVLEDEKNGRWTDGAGPSEECSQARMRLLTFGQGEH